MHWRNQIKSKARKYMAEKKLTGIGPHSKDILNDFEERALQAFGKESVSGIQSV